MPAPRDPSGRPLPPPPTWLTGIEDWVRRWAVPCGTVQARLVVEYQHGQPVLIRLLDDAVGLRFDRRDVA
jgi:hypothetical protein